MDLSLGNGFLKRARQGFIQIFSTSLLSLVLIHFVLDHYILYGWIMIFYIHPWRKRKHTFKRQC